jgi:hypothetical protein
MVSLRVMRYSFCAVVVSRPPTSMYRLLNGFQKPAGSCDPADIGPALARVAVLAPGDRLPSRSK